MAALVESLVRQAQATFCKSFNEDLFSECFSKLVRTINQLKSKDLNLNRELLAQSSGVCAPVTYIAMSENSTFTMGIFIVRNGARIPLHDHPGMHGVLKVIHGSVKLVSYSVLKNSTKLFPKDFYRQLNIAEKETLIPVEKHPVIDVSENDDACVLSPTRGNFHEILAMSGSAAFVDILAPPYDLINRDCHYYKQFDYTCSDGKVETCLLKTTSPRDYWCDSAPYCGPPVEL